MKYTELKNIIDDVEKNLQTDSKIGLSEEEATTRRGKYGYNELQAAKKETLFQKFLNQFKDFMIIILIIAAIVSGIIGYIQGEGITDSIIILIVVTMNAIIGVAQENRAEKSLEALQKLSDHAAKVIRGGNVKVIPARELVPGDVVVLDTGDYVPADLRIFEESNLKAQEASLTGESVPVEKISNIIEALEVGIGDRINMLFSSSLITYGRGTAVVVNTAMNTEVGKIADITIFDPNKEYIYEEKDIVSKSKNTPFIGKKLKGEVQYTMVNGKVVYQKGGSI